MIDSPFEIPCFGFCNPVGPDDPFGTPMLFVCDSLRVVVLALIAYSLILTPGALNRCVNSGQSTRVLTLAIFALFVFDTEVNHFGDYPSVRLLLAVVSSVMCVRGLRSMRTEMPVPNRVV